ncbi:MAG: hypothetical protein A2Y25_10625 [Candidatus Melainabacteria bacterium GWF2_37_15]|nr:MAG: hypothetical protein A2Y25_10625 [Candidatus Melainabacteria bacterium GWF2_37_15]
MATLEKERIEFIEVTEVPEIDKKALCEKLCVNILEGLLEGYSELKVKNPEKEGEFQSKIEELQKQLQIY